MNFKYALALACSLCFLLPNTPLAAQQKLLVLCTSDACNYRRVGTFLVGNRRSLRLLTTTADKVGAAEMKNSRELSIDQLTGLYRNPRSGAFYALDMDGNPRELALPSKVSVKDPALPASFWGREILEYSDAPNSKARTAVTPESFAYLLVGPDAEQAAFQLLQRLLEPSEADPRRFALIRGALGFTAKSPDVQRWRTSLRERMLGDLKRFDEQDGDPATLAEALHDAIQIRRVYVEIADDIADKELLDRIVSTDALFKRRVAVAEALRKATFWDEYLIKIRQLGLAKWSIPDILQGSRDAFNQSSRVHHQRFIGYTEEEHWDRAFDEAELAARNTCDSGVIDDFYHSRVLLVNHNQIASSLDYTGRNKALLEQLVRELDQLDPNKEQLTLDRIRRGEQLDPNFLPLQLKKAEFLDKLGRYTEALTVVQRIERNVRLDRKQLDEYLRLDGRITNNLMDAVQKSLEETRKQFELQKYQAALDAAARGLKADPVNASLLYYSVLSAAFLRQDAVAVKLVRIYLADSNVVCAPAGEPEKILELYRLLAAKVPARDSSDGIPHWISGVRYRPNEVFYDPISLGFLQPMTRISTDEGPYTLFAREDRSFLVKSISTFTATRKDAPPGGASTPLFEAEPKYDRQALSMLEIGSRANSAGDRTSYALTYLNSPGLNPDLVFHFTGRQMARGWAGNPFFHPLIWSGFYIFDLTYDKRGRVSTATPIQEAAGSRTDPFSEPLQFTWDGDSNRLRSIKGTRTGYLRELNYEKDGRLKSETISFPKGHGRIDYEYLPDRAQLKSAVAEDNFYDKRRREAVFDWSVVPR
jgi:hypothetical protein